MNNQTTNLERLAIVCAKAINQNAQIVELLAEQCFALDALLTEIDRTLRQAPKKAATRPRQSAQIIPLPNRYPKEGD